MYDGLQDRQFGCGAYCRNFLLACACGVRRCWLLDLFDFGCVHLPRQLIPADTVIRPDDVDAIANEVTVKRGGMRVERGRRKGRWRNRIEVGIELDRQRRGVFGSTVGWLMMVVLSYSFYPSLDRYLISVCRFVVDSRHRDALCTHSIRS